MAVVWVAPCGHVLTLVQVKDWTGVCPHCTARGETMVVVEQPKAGGDLYFWGDEMRETEMQRADEPVTFEREYHDALLLVSRLEAENAQLRATIEESANEERPARTPQDIVRDHVDHVVEHLKVGRTTKDQEAELTRALGDRKVGRALGR